MEELSPFSFKGFDIGWTADIIVPVSGEAKRH